MSKQFIYHNETVNNKNRVKEETRDAPRKGLKTGSIPLVVSELSQN
jgi:hypothetical protein